MVTIYNKELQIFNLNKEAWNKLYEIPIELDCEYDYVGINLIIPGELINPSFCKGPFDKIDDIYINLNFTGIDLENIYQQGMITQYELEQGEALEELFGTEFSIHYNTTDKEVDYINIGWNYNLEPSTYTTDSFCPILYFNVDFAKYLIEEAAELIREQKIYIDLPEEVKEETYRLLSIINKQNAKYSSNDF